MKLQATSVNGQLFPLKDAGKLFLLVDVPLQSLYDMEFSKDKKSKTTEESLIEEGQHLFQSTGYQNMQAAEKCCEVVHMAKQFSK